VTRPSVSPVGAGSDPHWDVAIIGAGPAALALGAACAQQGLSVCTIGPSGPWTATYGTWSDDLVETSRQFDGAGAGEPSWFAAVSDIDVVAAANAGQSPIRMALDRRYAVLDNDVLQRALTRAPHLVALVSGVRHHRWGSALDTTDGPVTARVVIDAAGSAGAAGPVGLTGITSRTKTPRPAFQTAYGVVVTERPDVIGGTGSVLMDWRAPSNDTRWSATPTFLYVLDLGAGRWLVEETSLARPVAVGADELRARLTARIGRDLTAEAESVEHVSIPMVPGVPDRSALVIGFGAAARYVHPATGYSVAASLRAAPRVAAAIAAAIEVEDAVQRSALVWEAVWPRQQRRSRAVHDFGLAALLRLSPDDLLAFFGAFFAQPTADWSEYLRIDAGVGAISRVMSSVFRSVPWSVRLQLAAGDPRPLVRLLR